MKKNIRWILLGLNILLFIVITINLFNGKIYAFDNVIYKFLINFESNNLTAFFKIITTFADTIVIIILCVILLSVLIIKKKDPLILVGTIVSSTVINQLLKYIISRPRPLNINKIIETGYSFPSGHAMASVSFYGIIIFLIIKSNLSVYLKWIISVLLTLLIINICISRVYLGVHYVSDVVGGLLLSSSLLLIITYVFNKYQGVKNEKSISNRSK